MASGAMASSWTRNSALLRIFSGCATGSTAANAVRFTGVGATWRSRPAGRSGCETTSFTSCPAAISACSAGTANPGVPQKTSLNRVAAPVIKTSPCAFVLHLADLAQIQAAFQRAHAEDEQNSVQVIDLVLKGARQQFLAIHLEPLALLVLRAHLHPGRALHLLTNIGKAQTALFFVLFAFFVRDRRIDEDQLLRRVFSLAQIDHRNALGNAHLLRRQPDPLRRIHGLEHVGHKFAQLVIKFRHWSTGLLQHRLRVFHNLQNHLCSANRSVFLQYSRICSMYPSKFRFNSVNESPPNFSATTRAIVSATIASAATPAAGTTQISLRS